jgi:small nuclear ribonucleoprotein (snRNP)-like protein
MSTRQLRLSDADQIQKSIASLIGKKINIVLTDDTVVFGELKKVNTAEIQLLNMRLKKVSYTFDRIAEVYLDTNA